MIISETSCPIAKIIHKLSLNIPHLGAWGSKQNISLIELLT